MMLQYGKEPSMAYRLTKNIVLTVFGLLMIYPLIWLFFSSFKTNADLFGSLDLLPETFVWDAYGKGWAGTGQYSYGTFFSNTRLWSCPPWYSPCCPARLWLTGLRGFNFR
ncbi:hypothetical protein LJK88_10520 [Paenibacillus sp. P26]|nr:hypothetical protein LJK88_10520 [Paenibacillus sp. P26]